MGRTPSDWERGGLLEGERRRLRCEQWRRCEGKACERRVSKATPGAADGVWQRSTCVLAYHSCCVSARRPRVTGVLAQHVEHVSKVQPDSTHTQQHFGLVHGPKCRLRFEIQIADSTTRMKAQPHKTLERRGRRY